MKTNLNSENIEIVTSINDNLGNRWSKCGDRFYLSDETIFNAIGLEIETYKTGAIRYAKLKGERISNTKATKIRNSFNNYFIGKCHIDLETGELKGASEYEKEIANALNAIANEITETLTF